MVLLQPEVKALFQEVITFLVQLDKAHLAKSLGSQARDLKQKIEGLCFATGAVEEDDGDEIYDEAGGEEPEIVSELTNVAEKREKGGSPPSAHKGSIRRNSHHRRLGGGGSYKPDEAEIGDASVASLENPTKQGFLDKKRPDSIMTKLTPYQSRYCVVYQGVFYYFDSQKAKKQSGAFHLKDYEARTAYQLVKSGTRKEGSFQMTAPGQRTYQFVAKDFEEMKQWIAAVAEWSEIEHEPISSIAKPSDGIDKNSTVSSGSDSGSITVSMTSEMDDEGSSEPATKKSLSLTAAKSRMPPPKPPVLEEQELYDEAGADVEVNGQELYDEAGADVTEQETYDEATPEKGNDSFEEDIYDCVEDGEETYDEAGIAPEPSKIISPVSRRPVPPPPAEVRPLPPPPPGNVQKTISVRSDDYGNKFYGVWKCDTSVAYELSFDSGDIIHVVDREHDESGWWTGILDGKVGLVPKSFLTPAYVAC